MSWEFSGDQVPPDPATGTFLSFNRSAQYNMLLRLPPKRLQSPSTSLASPSTGSSETSRGLLAVVNLQIRSLLQAYLMFTIQVHPST